VQTGSKTAKVKLKKNYQYKPNVKTTAWPHLSLFGKDC